MTDRIREKIEDKQKSEEFMYGVFILCSAVKVTKQRVITVRSYSHSRYNNIHVWKLHAERQHFQH
jgi:hypothetical protein